MENIAWGQQRHDRRITIPGVTSFLTIPGVTSFRAHRHGSFRTRPSQSFMAAEVWQYSTVDPIARLFRIRVDLAAGLLAMVARDSYVEGRGALLGKLLDMVVVADGEGEPFDVGELTTWLNEAVMIAPSMLLAAEFAPDSIETKPDLRGEARSPGRVHEGLDTLRGAAAIAVMLVGSPLLRGRYNRWGATEGECLATMPGDELVPSARLVSTRALTINAPPDAVWPWLVQIGQGRGGLYSYDALENLVGLDIQSADEIVPAYQDFSAGDLVRLGKPGSPCIRVAAVDPGRALVLISANPVTEESVPTPVTGGTGATWQWELRPVRDGTATRLVGRQRNSHPDRERLLWRLVEPVGFVMERRMLRGIKHRAERTRPPPSRPGPETRPERSGGGWVIQPRGS